MKRTFLALAVIVFNMFLFSCTDETVATTDQLYSNPTEGDDSDPPPPPPGG